MGGAAARAAYERSMIHVEDRHQDETELRWQVEQLLRKRFGRRLNVRGLKFEVRRSTSRRPIHIVSVMTEMEEAISLFLKQPCEQPDHPNKQIPDREVRVYEELLQGNGLPVVSYYGSRWNEVTKRSELFLEYVADSKLRYRDVELWFLAGRRLADMHAHFAARANELRACEFLIQMDAHYYQRWMQRALVIVAGQSAELAGKLECVVGGYQWVAEMIARQPLTLVHNDLGRSNVLVDRSQQPERICFVDWETAGAGCGPLDLMKLKCALGPTNSDKLCAAYVAELAGTSLVPSSAGELKMLWDVCELQRTAYRMALSKVYRRSIESVEDLVDQTCRIWSRIRA